MPLASGLKLRPYLPLMLGAGAAVCLLAAYQLRTSRRQRRRLQQRLPEPAAAAESLLRLLRDACGGGAETAAETPVLCTFGEAQCRLVVKNPSRVLDKLQTMAREGVNSLEVITDFDFTLSKFKEDDGRRVPSCHSILESYPNLDPADYKYLNELFNKYYPIEMCPTMTEEEKLPLMVEWWTRSHERMVQTRCRRDVLARTVQQARVALRDGWRQFFDLVNQHGIPCLIFSAGIGDIIHEILVKFGISGKLIRVVSNFMRFDENNELCGFSEPLIHTFNKRFSSFAKQAPADPDAQAEAVECSHRRNVLLMGDTTGDLRMSEGSNAKLVLTVGYLNDKIDDRMRLYADSFDIVCLEDPTLAVPLAVLGAVIDGGSGDRV